MTCSTNVNKLKSNASYIQNYLQTSTSFNPSYFVDYVNGQVSCINNAINTIKQNTIANGGTVKDANIAISQSGLPILLTVYQELLSVSNLQGLAYGANAQYQIDAQDYTLNKNAGNITSANEYIADQNKQVVYYNNLNALIQYLGGSALTPITSQNPTANAYIQAVNNGQQIAPKVSASTQSTSQSTVQIIPKVTQQTENTQIIPTSNNQYPSASISKTPTSQTSSTSQASIQNVSMLSRIYDFVSLYRDYFIGFLIVAMVIVVLIGKGKKHE